MVRDLAEARAVADRLRRRRRSSPRSSGPSSSAAAARRRRRARARAGARAGQPARRPAPALRAAPPPAARRGGASARDDERQPLRRADRVRGRRRARAARRRSPTSSSLHDRPIASRCDDSVARIVAGRAARDPPRARLRARARCGCRAASPGPCSRVGAQLKNTFCLARGDEAVLGPHVGDLDDLETYGAFEAAIARLEDFLARAAGGRRLRPPPALPLDALRAGAGRGAGRAARRGAAPPRPRRARRWPSTASTGRSSRSPGTAPGSAPTGPPGAASCSSPSASRFERLATFRPVRARRRRPGDPRAVARRARRARRRASAARRRSTRCPLFRAGRPEGARGRPADARGRRERPARPRRAGRAFDAAGRARPRRGRVARFEGQVALALDAAAGATRTARPYPFDVDASRPVEELDLRPLWRALAADVLAGVSPARLRPLPRRPRRGRGRARPRGAGRTGRPAGRAHRRLLPERPVRRGDPRELSGVARYIHPRLRSRPATAGSRSARRSSRTRAARR